jgi:hypothetical protein
MLGDEAAAKAAAARQAAAGLSHWFRFILISAFLFIAIVLLCLVSVAQLPPAQAGTGMCRLNGKLITTMKQMNALEPLPVLPMMTGRYAGLCRASVFDLCETVDESSASA